MNWVEQFDKEFIQQLGRKDMRKTYGVTVKITGTQYIEVYCEEDDAEDNALDEVNPKEVDDWEYEVTDVTEVDPHE